MVSLIIPVFNQKDIVLKNVSSWLSQDLGPDQYEVIIVDDGSSDGLGEELRAFSSGKVCLKYFVQSHRGPSAARNLGIVQAKGEILAFINADCSLPSSWLREISNCYLLESVAGVGGRIRGLLTGKLVNEYCVINKMNERPGREESGRITYLITANASFRKRCLLEVGGFNEAFTSACSEDVELCARLLDKQYSFNYNPSAVLDDPLKSSLPDLLDTYFRYGKGTALLTANRQWQRWRNLHAVQRGALFSINHVFSAAVLFIKPFASVLRIPLKYNRYRSGGLGAWRSFIFALFDCMRNMTFQYGLMWGFLVWSPRFVIKESFV